MQFTPDVDDICEKKYLLSSATQDILIGYLYDGTVLYTPNRLIPVSIEFLVDNDDAKTFSVVLKLTGEIVEWDLRIEILNILMDKCLATLDLQKFARDYYDITAKVRIKIKFNF